MYNHIAKPELIVFLDIETEFNKKELNPRKMTLVEYARKTSLISIVAHTYQRNTDGQWKLAEEKKLLGKDCYQKCFSTLVHATPNHWLVAHNAAFDFLVLDIQTDIVLYKCCLLYTSPSPRDKRQSRMPSSA